jgi:hypothetical protein
MGKSLLEIPCANPDIDSPDSCALIAPSNKPTYPEKGSTMSFEEALEISSRDEGFKATIYAINTLLIHKGIYTREEFQTLFVEWVAKEQQKNTPARVERTA